MTIRAKLSLAMASLLVLSTLALAAGVLFVSGRMHARDDDRRMRTIESLLEKAAQDALVQRDDLALVSQVNFLRGQYPSLAYVALTWHAGGRQRVLELGARPRPEDADRRQLSVADPTDPGRRIDVTLEADRGVRRRLAAADEARLAKTIAVVGAGVLAIGLLVSLWLSYSVTAPVTRLEKLAAQIAGGKLGASMEWASEDELGRLVRSFNTMSRRLEELDEAKKNFVSSVTHELRSPLGAVESFLVLIESKIGAAAGAEAVQCREYLGRVRGNVQRLSRFINDLLDVAKIEKGKMECALRPISLQPVARDVCDFFAPKAHQQGIQLTQRLDGLPAVMGDAERLRQVLVNLVSNSLKFTNAGGAITISGEQFREGDRRWVEISVRDNGRGMEKRDQALLFHAFSQGRNGAERAANSTKGTGLGLYISKSIVEQHGGKIGVESEPGRGTAISFSLQVAKES